MKAMDLNLYGDIKIYEHTIEIGENGQCQKFNFVGIYRQIRFGRITNIKALSYEETLRLNGQKVNVLLKPIPQSSNWGDNNRKKPYNYDVYIS